MPNRTQEPLHISAALVRVLERASLAAVATDPAQARRLALLASEIRLEANCLDRIADAELFLGHHSRAEYLAHRAAEMRAEVAA
jgi:hypothetical protein